jgi:prevent-host-death family protein
MLHPRRPIYCGLAQTTHIQFEFSPGYLMRYSTQIRPISYLKAHAAEIFLDIGERREPMIITQNGEAKVVIQDVASFEQSRETLALLKLLAIGNRDIENGRTETANVVVERLRSKSTHS